MSLENNISKVIQEQLQGDLIERVIAEQLEVCVRKSVDSLFGNWGDCKEIIEEKIKSVMVPQLERYDYSKHIVKLDGVLTEILKETTLDNKKILENFKAFMCSEDTPKEIKMSEIFNKYMEHVEKYVDTDDLEVSYDDGVSYEYVEVKFEVEESEGRSWSSFSDAKVFFECEHDKEMNFEFKLSKYNKDDYWTLTMREDFKFSSLSTLDEFTIFMMKLSQNYTHIIIDVDYDTEVVKPEAEPEASWS